MILASSLHRSIQVGYSSGPANGCCKTYASRHSVRHRWIRVGSDTGCCIAATADFDPHPVTRICGVGKEPLRMLYANRAWSC